MLFTILTFLPFLTHFYEFLPILTVFSLLSPPGGVFFSGPFKGGLIGVGGGGAVI